MSTDSIATHSTIKKARMITRMTRVGRTSITEAAIPSRNTTRILSAEAGRPMDRLEVSNARAASYQEDKKRSI